MDASVATKWHLGDEDHTEAALHIFSDYLHSRVSLLAPDHLRYEVSSACGVLPAGFPPARIIPFWLPQSSHSVTVPTLLKKKRSPNSRASMAAAGRPVQWDTPTFSTPNSRRAATVFSSCTDLAG